jgi:hypothetical protein
MNMKTISALILAAGVAADFSFAATGTGGMVSIGEVGEYRVILESGELRPRSSDVAAPTAQRALWLISCERVPGGGNEWRIEYSAWKPGDYDLRDLLAWSEGFNMERVRPLLVTVTDPLPEDHEGNLETPLFGIAAPRAVPLLVQGALVVGWLCGFVGLGWMAWGWHRNPAAGLGSGVDVERSRILRGMRVGTSGPLTPQTRAELHKQFLRLVFREFGITGRSFAETLALAQAHREAGPLLEEFDHWLDAVSTRPAAIPAAIQKFLSKPTAVIVGS